MRFIYQAKNSPDNILEGVIEADNHPAAAALLVKKGFFPLLIEEESISRRFFLDGFLNRIRHRDVNIFTQQLSNLISAGLPLLKTLSVAYEQTGNQKLKSILSDVKERVEKGSSLSEALKEHKQVFKNIYTALIRAGELSGSLDKTCLSLSGLMENEEDLRLKIQAALSYPILISIVGVISLYILFTFVIPKLGFLFLSFGDVLPLPTKILFSFSNFLRSKSLLLIGIFIIAFFVLKEYLKTDKGRFKLDGLILRIPLFGNFIKKGQMAGFTKTLGLLLRHGLGIVDSLEIASHTIKNKVLYEKINRLRLDVVGGLSLRESLRSKDYLDSSAVSLIAIAEESATLDSIFDKISDIYNREIERNVKIFTSLLEPIIILIFGIIVGLVVLAMLLPIFQMNLILR